VIKALRSYNDLVDKYPKSALLFLSRGRLRAASNPEGAQEDLERALALDADNTEVHGALGLLLHRSGEHARAAKLLSKAHNERPRDASLAVAYGRSLGESGKRREALELLELAGRQHPFDVAIVLTRAHLLTEDGDKRGAYDLVSEASNRIKDIRLIMAVGTAARAIGRYDQAVEIYEALARKTGDPNLAETARQIRAEASGAP
jgi:tetratricopeptide (TPR) repeat protein